MPIRFVTIAIIVLLVGGAAGLAVALNDNPARSAAAPDRDDDRKSDLERDLDAVLNNDEDDVAADRADENADDTDDTNKSEKSGGSGGSDGDKSGDG